MSDELLCTIEDVHGAELDTICDVLRRNKAYRIELTNMPMNFKNYWKITAYKKRTEP